MHDIKRIRADPAGFDAALARRGVASASAIALALDEDVRRLKSAEQAAAAADNDRARAIGRAKAAGDHALAETLLAEAAAAKAAAASGLAQAAAREAELDAALAVIPNIAADDVPDGSDETGNIVVAQHGQKRDFDFAPLEHDIVAARLGYDPEAAARIAGTRFAVLHGPLARLHRALGQYMLDVQTEENGHAETVVPLLVRAETAFGTGQLPKFEDDLFKTTDGRYLIPTAEVSLSSLVRDQIVAAETLPWRLAALTPCFRSEAGSAGRDTRGLIRQHQFDKVELVTICTAEQAAAEHERMTACAELILERLGLAWRRVLLCAGDMGFQSRKTWDLEVWLPGQAAWREISSISDCGDFQGRRMNARLKMPGQKGTQGFVHTLNGSGLAVGRTLVAVIENHQQADGSVRIPPVLHAYMGGTTALNPL